LQQLADQTAKINVNTLNLRIAADNLPGELLPIAKRLNESLARLEQSFEHERRFSSYVAHELRTPIAELRAIAELIIQYPDTRTTETDQDILNIALHLESIVQKLLTLSRAERAELQINTEKINLLQFVTNICQTYDKKINERNLSIHLIIPPDLTLVTDKTLFKSIITNLIENAVDYAPEKDEITIEIKDENSASTFKISNTAQDLTQEDIAHLFDRFWRKDTVRSPSSHIGLGLSLTRSMAKVLCLKLSVTLHSNSKIVFTLSNLKTAAAELHPVS
jgi:two-component system sensor histidine kinase QseC